jgi:kynurenine formamidase
MIEDGATLDNLELDRFMGRALLIECSGITKIDIVQLSPYFDRIAECEFIILNTGWSKYWGHEQYFKEFPVLTLAAVQWISRLNLKGIGVDSISVDASDSTTFPVHKTLLRRNMLIIENLTNLDQIKREIFTLCCFPLKIYCADGSPIRAVAMID